MYVLATELAHGGGYRGDHGPHFLFPLLLLIGLGFLIAAIIRRRRGGGDHHAAPTPPPPAPANAGSATAMAVLQERFARGEIDTAEYEIRRNVLEGKPAPRTHGDVPTSSVAPTAPASGAAPANSSPAGDENDTANSSPAGDEDDTPSSSSEEDEN